MIFKQYKITFHRIQYTLADELRSKWLVLGCDLFQYSFSMDSYYPCQLSEIPFLHLMWAAAVFLCSRCLWVIYTFLQYPCYSYPRKTQSRWYIVDRMYHLSNLSNFSTFEQFEILCHTADPATLSKVLCHSYYIFAFYISQRSASRLFYKWRGLKLSSIWLSLNFRTPAYLKWLH